METTEHFRPFSEPSPLPPPKKVIAFVPVSGSSGGGGGQERIINGSIYREQLPMSLTPGNIRSQCHAEAQAWGKRPQEAQGESPVSVLPTHGLRRGPSVT